MAKNFDLLDEILDDQERLAIQMFYDNVVQREAVRKVLLAGVYQNGTLKKGKPANPLNNFTLGLIANKVELKLTNEQIGEHLAAQWEGMSIVELAFSNLAKFQRDEPKVAS